jgi:catechol 2,3-dioxygenase-like lactoylglutathione lyase family enzyme
MQCLPPGPGQDATSWYRYADKFGARVHNMAFYVDDLDDLGRRLEAAGVRITDAGSGNTVFCHPKDTPGMLEFHPAEGFWEGLDPRFRAEWPAFRDAFWAGSHPLGVQRVSHVTVVVDDLAGAEKFYVEVLDAVPLPEQAATIVGGTARHVLVGEDTVLELLAPGDSDSVAARDLARVGPSVTGITFTVRDVSQAAEWMARLGDTVAEVTDHEIRLDVAKTWGCEYRFTDRVLVGDPRV